MTLLDANVADAYLGFIGLIVVIVAGLFQIQRTFSDRYRSQLDALDREYRLHKEHAAAALKEGTEQLDMQRGQLAHMQKQLDGMPKLQEVVTQIEMASSRASAEHATLLKAADYQRAEHVQFLELLSELVKQTKITTLEVTHHDP